MKLPPPPPPPLTADCVTTVEFKQPGLIPQQFGWKMLRSLDGKLRVDFGNTSVITIPALKQTITLDHLKREARIFPMPQAPQIPTLPGGLPLPQLASLPSTPMKVVELGKQIIEGEEAEGKHFIFQHTPQLPNVPQPNLPSLTHSVEVWTSTKTRLPLLTRMTESFGQQINRCKCAAATEPAPTQFLIPADYKTVEIPAAPKLDTVEPGQVRNAGDAGRSVQDFKKLL